MDVKTQKLRATLFFMVVIGVLIVAASVLVHRTINEHLIGRRDNVTLYDFLPFVTNPKVEGISAAVLISDQTAKYIASINTEGEEEQIDVFNSFKEQAMFWDTYLRSQKYRSNTINDTDLLSELHNYNLLILPFALCLSEEQIAAVKIFLEQGKGVIFTHSSGNRDETGKERDWSLTSDVLGGFPYYPIRSEQSQKATYRHIGASPLTLNTPAGLPTTVYTYDQPMAMTLIEGRAKEAAYWASIIDEDKEQYLHSSSNTAIAYGNYIRGRFIWIGFSPNSIVDEPDTWTMFDRLLNNSVQWVTYKTVAGRAIWKGNRFAAAISVIPQRDYLRALTMRELFTKYDVKPAFFVDYDQASFNRIILDQIAVNSELALKISDINLPEETNRNDFDRRIRYSKNELEKVIDRRVAGFETGSSNNLNYDYIGRSGYAYVWVTGERGTVPALKTTNYRSLFRRRRDTVVFRQSALSDRQIVEDRDITEPDRILDILIRDFNSARRTGSLYTLTLHSHIIGSERYLPVLEDFLKHIKSSKAYIASPSEIAAWWRKNDNINIRIRENQRRVNLMITNESTDKIESTTVYLYPRELPESLSIRAERINVPIPSYNFIPQETRIDLYVTDLNSGESRTYYIDFR